MNTRNAVDLRSDTVTRPTPAMRRAIAEAEVGDDVLGDDPTVIALQERMARLMGKEAALFVPSGSMANQTSIRALTEPSDEIIAAPGQPHLPLRRAPPLRPSRGARCGCSPGPAGCSPPRQAAAAMRPPDAHFPRTRLIVVENTHNRGGGTVWPLEQIQALRTLADQHGLRMHLDGARIWNACAASGRRPHEYAQYFDTVSSCFSKGLGAPVGSAVVRQRRGHPPRPPLSARCSAAACVRRGSSPPRRSTPWITTSSVWSRTIATPGGWPKPLTPCPG